MQLSNLAEDADIRSLVPGLPVFLHREEPGYDEARHQWRNYYSMTTDGIYKEHGSDWSHQVSAVATTQWWPDPSSLWRVWLAKLATPFYSAQAVTYCRHLGNSLVCCDIHVIPRRVRSLCSLLPWHLMVAILLYGIFLCSVMVWIDEHGSRFLESPPSVHFSVKCDS